MYKQECIPVGRARSAEVAVFPATHALCHVRTLFHACSPFAMHAPLPCSPFATFAPFTTMPPPSSCTNPFRHAHPPLPHMPPFTMHAPLLWLVHTARDRDWERWLYILCYVLFTLHRDQDRDRDREREPMGCIPISPPGPVLGPVLGNRFCYTLSLCNVNST